MYFQGIVGNSDFQKMRTPWTQIFAIFSEIQTILFFLEAMNKLQAANKSLTPYIN